MGTSIESRLEKLKVPAKKRLTREEVSKIERTVLVTLEVRHLEALAGYCEFQGSGLTVDQAASRILAEYLDQFSGYMARPNPKP